MPMPDDVKGTVFRENLMVDYRLAYAEQLSHLVFGYPQLKKCLLRIWRNALNSEKKPENLQISTNYGPKPKIFEILVFALEMFE
jgi:hypothetical protein